MSRPNNLVAKSSGTIRAIYKVASSGETTVATSEANHEFCARGLIAFPADVIAMRVRVANPVMNTVSPSTFTAGAINFTGMWLGLPLFGDTQPPWSASNAPWSGLFKSPPSSLGTAFTTNADGSDTIGGWVTNPAVLPRGGVVYGWSGGFLVPTNGQSVASASNGGLLFGQGTGTSTNISTSAQAGAAHWPNGINGQFFSAVNWLDIRIEVVMASMPNVVLVGDSIAAGQGHDWSLYPHEHFFGAAGQRYRFAAQNIGVGGNRAAFWAAVNPLTDFRYQRLDWKTSPPDAIMMMMGRNDLNPTGGNATAAQLVASTQGLMDSVRILAPRAKIYLCTLMPGQYNGGSSANLPSAAQELARQSFNAAVRSGFYGAHGIIDLDDAINPPGVPLNGDGSVNGNPLFITEGDPHPVRAGHPALANRIPAFSG